MRSNRTAGCLVVALLLVIALVVLGWSFRGQLLQRLTPTVEYTEVSPDAAASAEAKLASLRAGGEPVRLSEAELGSYLRYSIAEQYPHLMRNPSAAIAGDTLRVGGSVPTALLPELQELERIRDFLPDTTRLDLGGRLLDRGGGRAALEIEEVAVAGIPIPQRYYPGILERIGRRDEPGLPPNAIAFPLPDGVGSAHVEGGYLVLTPQRAAAP